MMDSTNKRDGGEVELLPCPWCGLALSEARVSEGSTFRWRKVDGCCADGPEVRHDTMAGDQAAAEVDSHRRAIEAWNTRANVERALAESRAEVAQIREACESYARVNCGLLERAERLAGLLRQCRDEMAGLPHSLGYDFTHLPKIDAELEQEPQE